MKPATFFLLLTPAAAWTFTFGEPGKVDDGDDNKGCTGISHPKNVEYSWDRGFWEDCCIRLYSDAKCADQAGFSCPAWEKTSSQVREPQS